MMRRTAPAVIILTLTGVAIAAPVVDKVEPPSWWTGHRWNTLQVLLTGRDLQKIEIASPSRGIRALVSHSSPDGRYAFVTVQIHKAARAGNHRFRLRTAAGETSFTLRLDPPVSPRGRFQGFTPDDVIYLIVPDRFANGDRDNDHPGTTDRAADRSQPNFYHGGDFAGIRARLPYLKDLGVTGIWMLPVYQNSRKGTVPGYFYGYEPVDFYDVESRFGSFDELRVLIDDAHRMGMKVIQDQVANHCGPAHPWVQSPPLPEWFHDLRDPRRLVNNFDIAALTDPYARPKRRRIPLTGWFAGNLPDLNQDNPFVRDYLIQNAVWWIGITGIDGVRLDTYPYVPTAFWDRWSTAVNRQFPRLLAVAEVTSESPAELSFFEHGARRDTPGDRLRSFLDFPLFHAMRAVFAAGQPFSRLTAVLAQDSLYHHPENLVAFFDNHDHSRFLSLASGDISRLLMVQTFLLSVNRIPQLFYGDEVAMGTDDNADRRSTAADFPGGFPGDLHNAFLPQGRAGTAATVFDHLRDLLRFRREHPALRRGRLMHLVVEDNLYIYLRYTGTDLVLAVFRRNPDTSPVSVDVDDLRIPDGLVFHHWRKAKPDLVVRGSRLTLTDPGQAELFWARP